MSETRADAHRETLAAPDVSSTPTPGNELPCFESWAGRIIDGRYRVDSLLGEGGMGAVLLAEHLKLQKKVALKVILPQFSGSGEVAERFAREAMAAGQLDHPHIASALDYGTLPEGGAYLVMQYVRGRSLRHAMADHRGDWAFASEVGAQIADALAAAHAARIVHRDLKPENVMLEERDEGGGGLHVRVLDFGIARVVDDERSEVAGARKLTKVGTVLGTPGYMAPEQALGESVDERADLYALGVVLWECITGRELFSGSDVPAILTAQLTTTVEPLGAIVHGVPAELDALIFRLLSPKRDDRPRRASEVRDALRKFALTRQLERVSSSSAIAVQARPSSISSSSDPFGTTSNSTMAGQAERLPLASLLPPALRTRRTYLAILASGALAFVALGVGVGLWFAGVTESAPEPTAVPVPVPVPLPEPTAARPTTARAPFPSAPPSATPPASAPTPPTTAEDSHSSSLASSSATDDNARDFDLLLRSESRETRRTIAQALLAQPEGTVPPLQRALARLELAEGCNAKRSALRALRELRDPRAIPAVERLDRLPRRGCGFLSLGDCWSCLRGETRRTLRSLRGELARATNDGGDPAESPLDSTDPPG